MSASEPLDVVALGRIAVDLYGEQLGTRLEEAETFRRYVGGTSGNLAIGCARLGLRAGMLSRVGDDPMGRYIRSALARENVDQSGLSTDPSRRTALAFLGMLNADAVALDFYRHDAADLAVEIGAAERDLLARARTLAISGTPFSNAGTAAVLRAAIARARSTGARIVLDIDLRPALWAQHGGGAAGTAADILATLADIDLVVGNADEFCALGGTADVVASLRLVRARTNALIVLKLGPAGSIGFAGAIPEQEAWAPVAGFPVEVLNVVGAGDAFLAGFLSLWIAERAALADCLSRGNAAGALVVSRHACSDAMPFPAEIDALTEGASTIAIAGMHRVGKRRPAPDGLTALAFDHRVPFLDLMQKTGRTATDVVAFKALVARAAREVAHERRLPAPGILIDRRFGAAIMDDFTEAGVFVARPVEDTGRIPLRFEAEDRLESDLATWHPRHVAKCLVWYHPDHEAALKQQQQASLRRLQNACEDRGLEWMLEVILPPGLGTSDDLLIAAVGELYAQGLRPSWLKLAGLSTPAAWQRLADLVGAADPHFRGVILLGLNQPLDELRGTMQVAANQPICKGFAIGRTIFMEPATAWFSGTISDAEALIAIKRNYGEVLDVWFAALAPERRIAGAA